MDAGWFLTGEHRQYLTHTGVFGPVTVNRPVLPAWSLGDVHNPRGYGAWEIAARFAYLDFADSDLPPDTDGNRPGVRFPQGTFGVNWYLADRMRVMFNYTYAAPNEVRLGDSSASIFSRCESQPSGND